MSGHRRRKGIDAGKYEILYDLPKGEYDRECVGGITTKTVRAGKMLEVECFPRIVKGDLTKADEDRTRRKSTKSQDNLNRQNAKKKVRRLLETNFGPGDYWITLTFDYGRLDFAFANLKDYQAEIDKLGLPQNDEAARRMAVNFLRRIKTLLARSGGDRKRFKYLYVIETGREPRDEDPHPLIRYHVHLVMSGDHLDRDGIEKLWSYGYVNTKRLQLRDNGLADLAEYITKQRRFMHQWSGSKNLKKPTVTVSHRKVSRRRAALVAADVRMNAKEIFEKLYPDYILAEEPVIKYSDYVAGAYIYARMRRRD